MGWSLDRFAVKSMTPSSAPRGRRITELLPAIRPLAWTRPTSPRRVKTFCGAITGMPRITDPERLAGEPRGRLLCEAGACQDFEMRCVALPASLELVTPEVAPISGHRSVDLSGAAGGLGDYVSGAGSQPPHPWPQKRAVYRSSHVTAIFLMFSDACLARYAPPVAIWWIFPPSLRSEHLSATLSRHIPSP